MSQFTNRWIERLMAMNERLAGLPPNSVPITEGTYKWIATVNLWVVSIILAISSLWVLFFFLPENAAVQLGRLADAWFWSAIKTTDIDQCRQFCRDLAFGMVTAPIVLCLGVGGAIAGFRQGKNAALYHKAVSDRVNATSTRMTTEDIVLFLKPRPLLTHVIVLLQAGFILIMLLGPPGRITGWPNQEADTTWKYAVFIGLFGACPVGIGGYLSMIINWPSPENPKSGDMP